MISYNHPVIFFPLHTDFPLGSNLASSCSSDLTSITGCFGDFPGLFEAADDDTDFALAASAAFNSCLTSSFLASILGVVGIGDDGPASVGVSGGVTGGSGTFFGVFLGVGGGLTISGLGFKLLGSTGLGLGLAGLDGLFCSGTTSELGFKVLAGLLGLTAIRKDQF